MEKRLVVTFSDGSRWRVPASMIAASRASYYAKLETDRDGEDYGEIYDAEYDYTLKDDTELLDWAHNNMNWGDVACVAFIIPSEKELVDKQKEWGNADKVIEVVP